MKNTKQRKYAHSNAYLVGNVVMIILLWLFLCFAIWFILSFSWMFKVFLTILAFFVASYIEHNFFTQYIAKIVEFLVSDDISTKNMQTFSKHTKTYNRSQRDRKRDR